MQILQSEFYRIHGNMDGRDTSTESDETFFCIQKKAEKLLIVWQEKESYTKILMVLLAINFLL